MQLNDILEAYSIRDISRKTNISEDNLKNLFDLNFVQLNKVKTMGFISIVEREYSADLSDFKNIANDYYNQHKEVHHYALESTVVEDKNSDNSKIFIVIVALLIGLASWYFFTQFDKKHLSSLNPFSDDDLSIESNITEVVTTNTKEDNKSVPKIDVINLIEDTPAIDITTILDTPLVDINSSDINLSQKDRPKSIVEDNKTVEKNDTVEKIADIVTVEKVEPKVEEPKIVIIEPSRRLWFGIRDIKTKKRDQFSVAKPYKLDVTKQDWLLATSPASFYLIVDGKKTYYKGGKAQYLKVTKDGIEKLTKREYVRAGGWRQW